MADLDNINTEKIVLPRYISDGIVWQRDRELKIWGWGPPREPVAVRFKGEQYQASVNQAGNWSVKIPPQEAGGPYNMEIQSSGCNLQLNDILIGEVWLCSGQSNMELPINRVQDLYQDEIAGSYNPEIREFNIDTEYSFAKADRDLDSGKWRAANPDSILEFSAVAYFFARKLYAEYQIPVGLITAAVGGSPVEAWLSEDVIKDYPQKMETVNKYKDPDYNIQKVQRKELLAVEKWYRELQNRDQGTENGFSVWASPKIDASDWQTMNIPTSFAEEGLQDFKGVIWLRKEIELPSEAVEKEARLQMGTIIDSDTAYINGKKVGHTGYRYPPRKYELFPDVLQPGKNTIVVRIVVIMERVV